MRLTLVALTAAVVSAFDGQAQTSSVDEARATSVTGQVTRTRDEQPWALSSGERVPVRQVITTGGDGYAHFAVAGGGNFDLFSNSRVVFRQNVASAGDLLNVVAGRVRIHVVPSAGHLQQRIFTPSAVVTALQTSTVSIAVDEDDTVRIDVLEGEVRVQHTKLPRSEPTIVRAVDAILVQRDEQISRRVDRGSLYRYTVKPLHDLWTAVTPGHSSHDGEPIEGNKFLAEATAATMKADGHRGAATVIVGGQSSR